MTGSRVNPQILIEDFLMVQRLASIDDQQLTESQIGTILDTIFSTVSLEDIVTPEDQKESRPETGEAVGAFKRLETDFLPQLTHYFTMNAESIIGTCADKKEVAAIQYLYNKHHINPVEVLINQHEQLEKEKAARNEQYEREVNQIYYLRSEERIRARNYGFTCFQPVTPKPSVVINGLYYQEPVPTCPYLDFLKIYFPTLTQEFERSQNTMSLSFSSS